MSETSEKDKQLGRIAAAEAVRRWVRNMRDGLGEIAATDVPLSAADYARVLSDIHDGLRATTPEGRAEQEVVFNTELHKVLYACTDEGLVMLLCTFSGSEVRGELRKYIEEVVFVDMPKDAAS